MLHFPGIFVKGALVQNFSFFLLQIKANAFVPVSLSPFFFLVFAAVSYCIEE